MGWWEDLLNKIDGTRSVAKKQLLDADKAMIGTYGTDIEGVADLGLVDKKVEQQRLARPFDIDGPQREKESIIKKRVAEIDATILTLRSEYHNLIHLRLLKGQMKSFWSTPIDFLIEGLDYLKGEPSEKEIIQFIDRVNYEAGKDYGAYIDAENRFRSLKEAVDQLDIVVKLMPQLILQNRSLTLMPFESHVSIESEITKLQYEYDVEERKWYFVRLQEKKHILNKDRWERIIKSLLFDLKNLKRLKPQYDEIVRKVSSAKIEDDLPTDEEFDSLDQEIDAHFIESSRYSTLKRLLESQRTLKQQRINEKLQKAVMLSQEAKVSFAMWQEQIDNYIESLSEGDDELPFPWEGSPPSMKVVDKLLIRIEACKIELKDWQSVKKVFEDKAYTLTKHKRLFNDLDEYAERKIKLEFNEEKLDFQVIKEHILFYKQFLQQKNDPNARSKIETMQLHLFFYAHKQLKNNQCFSWFRRTNWKGETKGNWYELVSHAKGKTKGYTGKRTRDTLKLLGWMNPEGQVNSESAPVSYTEKTESLDELDIALRTDIAGRALVNMKFV